MTLQLRRVYDCIVAYKKANDGNAPAIRDLCALAGVTSTSVMARYLEQLQRDNKIVLIHDGCARGIKVIGGRWTV